MTIRQLQYRPPDKLLSKNHHLKSGNIILPSSGNPAGLFSSTSLEDLGAAALLDRQEVKYIFPEKRIQSLLFGLERDYQILEICGRRSFEYLSIYYDTPDRLLFKQHQAGALPRWKIRQRTYLNSRTSYLEVKFKDNRGTTHKTRQQINSPIDQIPRGNRLLVQTSFPGRTSDLRPVLETRYTRITLVQFNRKERITLDRYLRFSDGKLSQSLTGLVVAEVKQEPINPRSPFITQIKQLGIRPGSFSKYCIGSLLLDTALKYNRFKPILLEINSLCGGGTAHEWPH